jgi:hypothetical protein
MPTLPYQIKAENLAYWYLRLNGYLMLSNFLIHPDFGTGYDQRTDVDILGVRFPYRSEIPNRPMDDDPRIILSKNKTVVLVGEVKKGVCALNGPWTNPEKKNMRRIIQAIGTFKEQSEIEKSSNEIYSNGFYTNDWCYFTLACFGIEQNDELSHQYSNVPQILWSQVINFIHNRFYEYYNQKKAHNQWDEYGRFLWEIFNNNKEDLEAFKESISIVS